MLYFHIISLVRSVYGGRGIGTWNEVDDDDEDADKDPPTPDKEMAFMDEEPSADVGIAGALQLAMKKGMRDSSRVCSVSGMV